MCGDICKETRVCGDLCKETTTVYEDPCRECNGDLCKETTLEALSSALALLRAPTASGLSGFYTAWIH